MLKVYVRRDILCTEHAQQAFFIFDRLSLMIHVLSEDRKGVIFLSLIALSSGVNNFVQKELLF